MRTLHLMMLAAGVLTVPLVFAPVATAGDTHDHETVAPASADADNTKRNARDAGNETLTPLDQGGSESDRTITQQIRKAVVGQDTLSTNAKNVKIITQNGVVTLRGPVKSTEERAAIAGVAQKTGGVTRVDNQLEIERN